MRLYAEMDKLTSMIGSILVAQLLQIALSRSETDDRPEFHLYCDEFELFETKDFSDIISQAGKYNLIPYIAHQSRGQISEENQDNVIQLGNLFCFRLIGKDAKELANSFDTTPLTNRQKVLARDVFRFMPHHSDKTVQEFGVTISGDGNAQQVKKQTKK